MEQANIPQQAELSQLYGAWNPMGYMRGQLNQDLADQFRQQAFYGNEQGLKRNAQVFDQATLMNPLEVAGKTLENEGKVSSNLKGKLEAERMQASQQANIDADVRAAALKMTDDQFKAMDQGVEKLLRSDNPEERKRGMVLQSYMPTFQAERRKAADALALQQEQTRSHLGGIGMQNKTQKELEQMRIDAGKYDKAKRAALSVWESISSGKLSYEKAAVVMKGYANQTQDPEEQAMYQKLSDEFANEARNLRGAGATGKPDLGAMGVPVQSPNEPYSGGKAKPGTAENPIVLK